EIWEEKGLMGSSRTAVRSYQHRPVLRFDGEAFRLKRTGELVRALLVLRLCAWPPLVTHGLTLLSWSRRLLGSRLSGALLRASVYGQFVAGETTAEVQDSVQRLQGLGLRPLLAVPIEEEPGTDRGGEAWYEGNLKAMLHCVDLSGLGGNGQGPHAFSSPQDTHERLTRAAEEAERKGLGFGVKLVRGAYLESERALARERGTADPTQPDYEATSRSYSRCLELMLGHVCRRGSQCQLMVASHNEESVHQAVKRMSELGIPLDGPVCFGQLLGMCDHVSLALGQAGYAIYKSIPYGALDEVIPYLLRRAQENRSVLQGARREQGLLSQELLRRLSRSP
uniref:Proline dehydrogenase n=1 Tax=Sarcophilus harrisii TaxID=9305 RepID=G3W7P0_SARHA